ncbi:MAG: hypothetical protein WBP02_12045 [Gammaproteobacteria bacterium]
MTNKKFKNVSSTSQDPYGPAPQQMNLFPEEKPGLKQMKIKTLLKAYYKTVDNDVAIEQTG